MKTLFKNANIVTPTGLVNGCLLCDEDILYIGENKAFDDCQQVYDMGGKMILPGFIDIHADMIENLVEPRATAFMDMELALKEAEKQLIGCGITTIYHSISMFSDDAWEKKRIRRAESVKKLSGLINAFHHREHLIHHRLHLRYEIDNVKSYDDVENLVNSGQVHLLSFMDHSPGQGQYRNLEVYKSHLPNKGANLTEADFAAHLEKERAKAVVSLEALKALSAAAQKQGIAVASHDDDTTDKIDLNAQLNVNISEFPITQDVAAYAKAKGLFTVFGAPNILLGGSHSGNVSAAEAILEGNCHILCSDYYPASLLHAVFYMHKNHAQPLHDMVNMVSLNPAKAVGIDNRYGALEAGKTADLLVVDMLNGYPVVEEAWIQGKPVTTMRYRI